MSNGKTYEPPFRYPERFFFFLDTHLNHYSYKNICSGRNEASADGSSGTSIFVSFIRKISR